MSAHLTRAGRRILPTLALSALGCAPKTSLQGDGRPGDGSASPTLPSVVLLEPSPGMAAVPTNLSGIVLGLPADVPSPASDGSITLSESSNGTPVVLGSPTPVDCAGRLSSHCVRLPIAGSLLAATTYVVTLRAGLSDDVGRPLAPGRVAEFTTTGMPDLTPPAILTFSVEPSGPCVVARFETDEPAAGRVVVRIDGDEHEVLAGTGTTRYSAVASLMGAPAGARVQVFARAIDLAANVGESTAVELPWERPPPAVAITEIHANPAGPEPAQEFVELKNLGPEPIDLGGLALEDEKGTDVLPAALLGPGAYALVIPALFDAASEKDTPPAAGTLLIRVDNRLGSDGLSNAGESVRLRGAGGQLVSSYGVATPVSATGWSGKSVHRVPEEGCDQPAGWTQRPLPATPGWGPP